jgi:PAS domain S-box-containing protein
VWDPEFRITLFNHAFERVTGLSSIEVVGYPLDILFAENRKEEAMAHIKRTLEGEYWESVEIPILHKNGTIRTLLWNSANIYDDNGEKIVATIAQGNDITERKQLENTLENNAKNLEKLVEERTKALKNAERLAAIGATAGMVGHDIRNPLQAITSDIYLAGSEVASLPENEQKKNIKESLDEISKSVEYVNKIVADLQDYARPLKPVVEETDLKDLVKNLLIKSYIPGNIKVSNRIEKNAEKIVADPAFLKRVLGNLVSNAVQAMPDGGKLFVHAYKDAEHIAVKVQDTGVGISEEAKEKLFTPLFTTKSKGQGFGLAVVKRLTETMGGTVTFETQIGKGTTFIIKFPVAQKQK